MGCQLEIKLDHWVKARVLEECLAVVRPRPRKVALLVLAEGAAEGEAKGLVKGDLAPLQSGLAVDFYEAINEF